jgi:hypothetical protein
MAPFLTHLVVGERVWKLLDSKRPAPDNYGGFLFGCLAPDVDKLCEGLEQGTTHFVAKDRNNSYVWQRSQRFLDNQSDFLRAPFCTLEAHEQAFVLGYLCHVATDEITGRLALSIKNQTSDGGQTLPRIDAILSVMDPRFWAMAFDPHGVVEALEAATIPDGTLVFAPVGCLVAMHKIVVPQVREGGGMVPYLNMMRRQRQWMRHGQVSDATDDAELEAELVAYRRQIEADLPASERLVGSMELESFVDEAVSHSLQRIHALLPKERAQ